MKIRCKVTKRHFMPVIIISMMASSLLVGCADFQPRTEPVPTPASTPTPEPVLIKFKQLKLTEFDHLNTELDALKPKISEAEAKVESEQAVIRDETEKVNQKRREKGLPEWHWGEPINTAEASSNLIKLLLTAGAPGRELDSLKGQEQKLLGKKQYVEGTIAESNQQTKLADYYEFKLSQLKEWTTRLLELKLDIDQQFTSVAQQEYNLLLMQRQQLQEDIKQIELLLGKN